jgi:hypothetical protein
MSDSEKIVQLHSPTPEASSEERARRLAVEVERLARLPLVEWMFYVETGDVAKKHDIEPAKLKAMVEAVIRDNEKKAREAKADDRREKRQGERKQERADKLTRQEEERKRKQDERDRKEIERVAREEEARRKKLEEVFVEIAALPRMTHAVRLKEAAARLKEDPETLIEEFEVFFASYSLPPELVPWPDPVDTAELLAGIEAKFRRYVVTSDANVTATTLWAAFTYLVEIALFATKLLFQFPERDAGKSTALDVIYWMVQRPYLAIEATGPVLYRIIDRLKPTLLLDEADSLFKRSTVLGHIINSSFENRPAKIARSGRGKEYFEYEHYCTQAIGMKGLGMPDTTLSRCIICRIWPALPSEKREEFGKRDDAEFVTLRRKLMRWSVDNAVALQAARPEGDFSNRTRDLWKLLWAIADLAGGTWPKRARAAALELEADRDEPSEGRRLFAALRDVFGKRDEMTSADTSADICVALNADPAGEWVNFRDKGPISQTQLAAVLREYGIKTQKVTSPTGVRLNPRTGQPDSISGEAAETTQEIGDFQRIKSPVVWFF